MGTIQEILIYALCVLVAMLMHFLHVFMFFWFLVDVVMGV